MKLRYGLPKGQRYNYGFIGMRCVSSNLWFNEKTRTWGPLDSKDPSSNVQYVSSMKAFRRQLKKIPKGHQFRLISRWVGPDVFGVSSKCRLDDKSTNTPCLWG